MVLNPSALSSGLRDGWLPGAGGPYPGGPRESGDAFAGAVSGWFAAAVAGPHPCSTAAARRPQLAAAAAAAFGAGQAPAAGALLATALTAYMSGQVFGPGAASPPAGTAAAQALLTAVFADLGAGTASRADRIAQATWALALTAVVVFPPVVSPPVPVT
ncbi:hypothetical protein [Actinomadura sp. 21ATH]|uniref:hypothetical protein n=1 Tax=Actinomadura sp. 21ATH TaxID=1735444 RepID=UPI0035BF5903